MSRHLASFCLGLALVATEAAAQPVSLSDGWKEQRFSLFSSNEFTHRAGAIDIRSKRSVSLVWKALSEGREGGRTARWRWAVERSVPPTDLTRKGGDDRNLALYFLFMPEGPLPRPEASGVRALLANPDVRVLMYVWGGAHARGDVLPSPYLGARGRTVILRGAGTGAHDERVNLERDFRRAFGGAAPRLVGVALSSDSDDTRTEVVARLSDLLIE